MKIIPNSLRRYRRVRGLKQTDVAAILGVKNAAMISRWEKGQTLPSTLNVFSLSIIYSTTPDALYLDFIRALREKLRSREEACRKEA